MEIILWGVRGSMAVCENDFIRYGGNTTCIEVRGNHGESVLLDAGSGIVTREKYVQNSPVICLTHFHIDHLLGLPFLSNLYNPLAIPEIYAPLLNVAPSEQLRKLFDGVFWPVKWDMLPPQKINEFSPGSGFAIGSLQISTTLTNHPGGCVAYKITDGEWTFAYTGDHEITLPASADIMCDFLADADVILADATYTEQDYIHHVNWGHSHFNQWSNVIGPNKFLLLAHYNPKYTDKEIDGHIEELRKSNPDLKVEGAREGCIIRKNSQVKHELRNL